jgi:hypothetical protein
VLCRPQILYLSPCLLIFFAGLLYNVDLLMHDQAYSNRTGDRYRPGAITIQLSLVSVADSHNNYCILHLPFSYLGCLQTHWFQGTDMRRLSTHTHSNIYPISPVCSPSCHPPPLGRHAVFKALHPPRLHPSSYSGSSRLSYRAPHSLRSRPPELTLTRA